jgi:hypothetical protein
VYTTEHRFGELVTRPQYGNARHPVARAAKVPTLSGKPDTKEAKMLTGFKAFLLRGNVVDLAVAVVTARSGPWWRRS